MNMCVLDEVRTPIYLTSKYLKEELKIGTPDQIPASVIMKVVEDAISSPACMNGCFISRYEGRGCVERGDCDLDGGGVGRRWEGQRREK